MQVRVPIYVRALLWCAIMATRCGVRFNSEKLAGWVARRVRVSVVR
jgi:hypothetical protein